MQPYFLPYLGYISLLKHTDQFILLDTVQHIYHGWIERNRILKPNNGWQYIKVPLIKHSREELIKNIAINNELDWKSKIFAQVVHYKRIAPYYRQAVKLLELIFEKDYFDIVTLNHSALQFICDYLDISKEINVFSKQNISIAPVSSSDEWALNICRASKNVDEYWNLSGGLSFFDRSKFQRFGIEIKFHSIVLEEYNQKRITFESGLSILDVIMFNSVQKIHQMLDNYELQ